MKHTNRPMKHTINWMIAGGLALTLSAGSAVAAGVDELPPDIAKAYDGLDPQQPQGPSAYRDWKPKKGPPWTVGYASSYAGNSWRAAAMDRLLHVIVPEYQKAGLLKDVVITQSDLKELCSRSNKCASSSIKALMLLSFAAQT